MTGRHVSLGGGHGAMMTSRGLRRWGILGLAGGGTLLQVGGCAPVIGETIVRIAFDMVFFPLTDAIQQGLADLLGLSA